MKSVYKRFLITAFALGVSVFLSLGAAYGKTSKYQDLVTELGGGNLERGVQHLEKLAKNGNGAPMVHFTPLGGPGQWDKWLFLESCDQRGGGGREIAHTEDACRCCDGVYRGPVFSEGDFKQVGHHDLFLSGLNCGVCRICFRLLSALSRAISVPNRNIYIIHAGIVNQFEPLIESVKKPKVAFGRITTLV